MTAAEFKAAIVGLWGADWRKRAPTEFNVTVSTIDRWVTEAGRPNHSDVHPCAEKLLEHLLDMERRRKIQRSYERTYKRKIRGGDHGS